MLCRSRLALALVASICAGAAPRLGAQNCRPPRTALVLSGGAGEAWMAASARAVAETVPHAWYESIPGQDHGVLNAPESLRTVLTDFLR